MVGLTTIWIRVIREGLLCLLGRIWTRACVFEREKVNNDLKEGALVTQGSFVSGPRVDCVAIIFNKESRQGAWHRAKMQNSIASPPTVTPKHIHIHTQCPVCFQNAKKIRIIT